MFRMEKVCVLMVNLHQVEQHSCNQIGQHKQFSINGVATQLARRGDVKRQADEEEQQPPLEAPDTREQGNEARHDEGDDDEHGARNERLLNGLVDEVDIARDDGLGNVGQQSQQTLYLRCHPA